MLIIQPYLVRSNKLKIHRAVGKFSYFLVPLLVLSTADLLKYKLVGKETLENSDTFFIALAEGVFLAVVISQIICFLTYLRGNNL